MDKKKFATIAAGFTSMGCPERKKMLLERKLAALADKLGYKEKEVRREGGEKGDEATAGIGFAGDKGTDRRSWLK